MRGVYDGCARITWGLFILPQPLFTQLEAHLKFGTNSFFGERIARGKSKWSTPIRLSNIKALPFDSFCRRYDAEILHIIPDMCIISSMLFISCVVYATTVQCFLLLFEFLFLWQTTQHGEVVAAAKEPESATFRRGRAQI